MSRVDSSGILNALSCDGLTRSIGGVDDDWHGLAEQP